MILPPEDSSSASSALGPSGDGKSTVARTASVVHQVRKGESLWQIASTYNVTVEALRRSNSQLGETLRVGDQLIIPTTK